MNEQQVLKIVKDEINRQKFQSGKPDIYPHIHDDVSTPKLPISSIIYAPYVLGKINFARNTTYTLYFSHPNPTRIDMNGFVFNQANNSTALIVGIGLITSAKYFQPRDNSSAKEGGTQYPINGVLAQCSSNLYVNQGSPSIPFPHTDQFFVANAFSTSGTILVTAELANVTNNSIDIIISNLASGWTLSANFVIT